MRLLLLGCWLLAMGCGAKVVVQDGETATPGEGGGGGGDPGFECILGGCGDPCVKCGGANGDECFDGQCTSEGTCLPPGSDLGCADPPG